MHKIFVVEDEEDIRELVLYALGSAGYEAVGFTGGEEFFAALSKADSLPDLIVLDIMLPECDGLTLLKRIRASRNTRTLPVILLTAKSAEMDKVKGLDLGADDYVTKPFGVMELMSRVNALLRRSSVRADTAKLMTHADIKLDDNRHTVYACDEKVYLTYKEYSLLHYLMSNEGRVLSRQQIMDVVWGFDFEGESRTIDMHIRSLRAKLGRAGGSIKTVRNVGYMLGG
jgi:two-component system alkaline phosphatase synthesis response regulator PhoP